jgi:hypothetical protein
MKTKILLLLISMSAVLLSCDESETVLPVRDEIPVETRAVASFATGGTTLAETATGPAVVTVRLSRPAKGEGKVVVTIVSNRMNAFVTDPQSPNGELVLNAAIGDSVLYFKVQPLNDDLVGGHVSASFSIASAEGSIETGSELGHALTIKDDELSLKFMGYESTGSGDVVRRVYEYDAKGRISKVNWETETHAPSKRSGTETWFYDENDRLIKINKYPGRDVHYAWDIGKIWKADEYQDGTLVQYTIYSYDMYGNISGATPYYRQADGSFRLGLFSVFLYFTDGNIHKSLTYTQEGEEDPVLVSTRTYDNYIDVNNPFPMVEILPNVRSQTKLATSYRVEENGFDFLHAVTYEFRADGLPGSRIATAAGVSETTVYQYY